MFNSRNKFGFNMKEEDDNDVKNREGRKMSSLDKDLINIFSAIGSIAVGTGVLTVIVVILNIKYKPILNKFLDLKIFNKKLTSMKLHKFLGVATILLGSIHGFGMLFFYPEVLKRYSGVTGLIVLILFWILGLLPVVMKKVPLKYKKVFMKSHKVLGIIIFIFILIHIFSSSDFIK